MPGYQSAEYSPVEWNAMNRETLDIMKKVGAVLPEGFFSTGVPQVVMNDLTIQSDDEFSLEPFKGRLIFREGSRINAGNISPFPHDTTRITLLKWGKGVDECGKIVVGKNTELNGTALVSYTSITIGEGVLFGPNAVIMDSDGHPADRRLPDIPENKKMAPVVIGDHAWIGLGAMIMKGVSIGHHAVIAAHALVTKDVPPHCVAAGNPARIIKDFSK